MTGTDLVGMGGLDTGSSVDTEGIPIKSIATV